MKSERPHKGKDMDGEGGGGEGDGGAGLDWACGLCYPRDAVADDTAARMRAA
jgi:hypothetical protein